MRTRTLLLPILLLTGLLASCGGSDDATLVIYSGRGEDLVGPLVDQFEEETGIDVNVNYAGSAELALLIREEGDKSPADLFLSQSPGAVGFLEDLGVLAPLPSELLDMVDPADRSGSDVWVGISGRKRVLVYNQDSVDVGSLPASVLDLTDNAWSGRVGVAPGNGSFLDFVTAMRFQLGDDVTLAWLEALDANGVRTYPSNSSIVEAVGRGEVDVGLVNHYYNVRALAEDDSLPSRNHHFADDDIGSTVIIATAAILEGSDRADDAQRFIEFLLENDAQTYFATETFEYPLRLGAGPPEGLPALSGRGVGSVDFDALGADLASTLELVESSGVSDGS
ncbi:MAG: iron ABC transporter substrate-binding protein [Actinomycetia bacterium]|nr:iron ABC transporter substrate-binding protein [Actinomycetes bacterium]